MSSLFGQVWLWSLLSFVAGVALTWLVLVRPAKQELQDLEDRFLSAPRPTPPAAKPTPAPPPAEPARDELDDWHAGGRSPVEDLLREEEPPRYDVAPMKRDERDRSLDQVDDERRPPVDFEEQHDFPEYEDDRPRSLFERLSPDEPAPVGAAVPPAPAPAAPQEEPTAPPEVEAFQPREVWRQDSDRVPEVYGEDSAPAEGREQEDEPETPAERTALIPATALAQAIAEADARSADEPGQLWPDRDLTGEYPVIREDSPRSESTTVLDSRTIADRTPDAEAERKSAGERSGGDESADEPFVPRYQAARDEEPEYRSSDEPFVPKFQPEGAEPLLSDRSTPAHRAEPDQPFTPMFQPETAAPDQPFTPTFRPEHVPPKTSTPEPFTPSHQAEPEPPAPAARVEPPAVEQPARVEPPVEQPKPAEPARPRSLFEPVLTPDDVEEEPPPPPRPARPAGDDQPFVPKLAPELLEKGNGLPQRPVRPAGVPRTPPPPPPASKQSTPPPSRPARPRPVGFSPSTGGRPANGATTRYQQPEGFNPRSPFGPGSVLPKSDGMPPAPDFHVKATLAGRRYFTSESTSFGDTRADVWFRTTSDAEKAGFRPA